MRSVLLGVLASICVASSVSGRGLDPVIADSPQTIRPLLIGASVPDLTLADLQGAPVELSAVLAKQPSIIIFYRGGW